MVSKTENPFGTHIPIFSKMKQNPVIVESEIGKRISLWGRIVSP